MREKLLINGGNNLSGEVEIGGAKNSAVALIVAAILARDIVILTNVKLIEDVFCLISILEKLNVNCYYDKKSTLIIDSRRIKNTRLDSDEVYQLRASYYFMGALMSLFDHAEVGTPGGCNLGERPIDLHLLGFSKLGFDYHLDENIFIFDKKSESETTINLPKISVGATINILLASIGREKRVVINNIAIEPEIKDVIEFLKKMGANIKCRGRRLTITPQGKLRGVTHKVIPDRIEAGTFMILGSILSPYLKINNINIKHLRNIIDVLSKIGVSIEEGDTYLIIRKQSKYTSQNIKVKPYPGFPTDLQQPLTVLLSMCDGESSIEETIYPARLSHVDSLNKMGADIRIEDNLIKINGVKNFKAADVDGEDLRGGISLVLAALLGEGESKISGVKYIKRGYSDLVKKIKGIGGNIKIIGETNK